MTHTQTFQKVSDQRIVDHALDCPTRKFGYRTKAITIQEISILRKEIDLVQPLYPYKCPLCRYWHMTRSPQK